MHQMIELHPRPDALNGLGLPAIPYPVALPTFQAAVANDGELPLADMLHGLQLRAAIPDAKWQALAPAMARLSELLADDETAELASATVDGGSLELGPLEPGEAVVVVTRDGVLLAAMARRPRGGLRACTWQPLDARSADLLMALGARGAHHGQIHGRDGDDASGDDWFGVPAGVQPDADPDVSVRVSWHPEGLGDAGFDLSVPPRPPAHVAAELRVRRTFSAAPR